MTNFGNKGRKNYYKVLLNLPMVAISQRSIPNDQLYENKKRSRNAVLQLHVLNTTKILMYYEDKLPQTSRVTKPLIHARSSTGQVALLHMTYTSLLMG